MTKKIFKGIKQVSFPQFSEAKEANLLNGYLWFVRTEVSDGETNDVSNDDYDIYFGSRQYGHFRAGELEAIRQQIEKLAGDVEAIYALLEQLTGVAEEHAKSIENLGERVTANEGAIAELQAADEAIRGEFADADALLDERLATVEGDVKDLKDADISINERLTAIEGSDAGKSMREVALDELSKQLLGEEKAEDNFKTLQDLAAWLEEHPEDVAEMNTKINANASAITALEAAQSLVDTKIAELVKADEDINSQLTTIQEQVDAIPVIESVNVNGVEATIENGEVSVKVDGDDIEIGVVITGKDNAPAYEANTKLSTILQGINDSIRAAEAGGVNSVTSGDNVINVNNADINNPKVSLLVEEGNEDTVKAGHVELVKGDAGLYGVMYYDGDDAE